MAQSQRYKTPFGPFSDELVKKIDSGEINSDQVDHFLDFLNEISKTFMEHTVITDNEYCTWFNKGEELNLEDVRDLFLQFTVFSHLFLIAQLKKMINSSNLEQYRASKEILANELGVIFKKKRPDNSKIDTNLNAEQIENAGDPNLVSTEGSVDGGTFKFKAGHFEWLVKIGNQLGIDNFSDMGKRKHGTDSTLFFCDELERLYGSEDANIGAGASFSVENWAAAGFWKDLISGLKIFRENNKDQLPDGLNLGFFTWHDKIEDQHADHVLHELEEVFFEDWFNKELYIKGGVEMLDGVMAFWEGLDKSRLDRRLTA
jgi:hypothetical protein